MGIYIDYIQARSLGTGTGKTQLSGDLSGNATSWKTPTSCNGILWVQPILSIVTRTSTEASVATMSVESNDLSFPPFEVLATPLANAIATNDSAFDDRQDDSRYPLMFDASDVPQGTKGMGGANVNFYGIPQVANTAAPFMGAKVWWTDESGLAASLRGGGGPFRAVVGGAYAGGGASTSTGTATGQVTGKTATIAGQSMRTLRGVFGVLTATTSVTAKPITGAFLFSSTELPYLQRLGIEPLQAPLGTNQVASHLSRDLDLRVPFTTPTTLNFNAYFDQITSTAGNFSQGVLFQ